MTLSCNANNLQPLVMALSGRPELKGFYAKDVAERRRLGDVLCDQLSRDLLRLLNDEIHTDLTLNVGQTKFKVHKAVIMARAPKFYMFVTRQETEDTFTVQNVEPSEIKAFLKIVYASLWSVKDTEDHILHMINNQSVSSPDHSEDKCSNLQSTTLSAIKSTSNNSNSESLNLNAHPKETYNCDDPCDCEPPSELGKDLLSLFKCSCCTDVTIQIEDKCFHVHRAILCARSSYFAAMLSGCWAETSRELIKIQGVKQADMKVIMHFIYGGIMDLPKSTDPGQVLSIADMYGLEGLREVAVYVLKRDYCKFFHKPTVGMQQSVLECLSIAYSVGEEPLYTSCMRWIEKYFVKCWSERSFANLPVDLQKNCFTLLVQSLSYRNAAFLLMESDRLISSLPGVKWADRARSLASELQEECVRFIVTNFSQIIRSESFAHLLQAQGMSSRPYLLEHVFNEIEKSVSFQNCSFLFMALDELLNLASENKMVFTCKIQALRDKLWSFLVQSFYAVRHTEGWKLMRPSDQSKIQAVAFDKGDDRRLAKKPIFTSSQQNRSKSVISGQTQPTETKRHSDTDLLNHRKMKSDSLGASGHTANVSRNSSGKGKDDVKGKDVKKVATKGSKEPKPTERMTTAKPKIIVKAKPENNDNTKTESCASKCDTSSTPNPAPSEKMGTRPKASNGTSNPPAKVKLLKKAGKDPSSPVRGSAPSMKFANCNGELSNSSLSSGEQGHDQAAAEQPNSTTSSPQVNKTLKNSLDSSKDLGMGAKSKSSAKMSNGSSVKRKVNEAESREVSSSSSTKKVTVDGGNDSVLQKKKGNKISTCTDLRPKSAPAALSKKQGIPGDSSKMPKSVSSKQTEVKSDSKLVNQPTSADKHGSLNKNTTKTTFASASKTQSNVQSNKNSVSKSSITNHKESKAKLPSTSKTSNLQNRTNQKSSPSAVKNGNNKPSMCLGKNLPKSDGSESPVSVANEGKQAASCQFEEGAEHSEDMAITSDVSCQDDSMGNQESMVQKPDLEHCPCQENNLAASVLHYPSNSKEGLTEDTNQTKVRNVDSAGSDEVPFVSLSSEQKPDCKNICDSENSKCADSSSESELCSVKEVERVPKQKEREDMTFMEFSENTTNNMQSSSNAAESCLQSVSTSHQHAMHNGGHLMNCTSERQIFDYQRDMNITEVADSHQKFDIKLMGPWNKHSSMLHERESPESESGSASTSSDDIKPRSEDYDAGGSQDDDGSNERGISKCSTMRCHDFLGRSSSDTSTPEELKGYDGSLRIDVKLKKDSSELFRVNSTSDDEGPRKRTEPWLQRDLARQSANHTNVCGNVQFSQEIEHLSSSADETEDERSEAENPGLKGPSDVDVQPYQGIINLAFDDNAEIESDGQRTTGNKSFMRSVLLSVDECEELGSDEGDLHASQVRKAESLTPTDVFEKNNTDGSSALCSECSQIEEGKAMENTSKYPSSAAKQLTLDESSMTGQVVAESDACKATYKPTEPESELKSQARPCHLDLYTELPSDTQRYCCTKTAKACKSQFLDYQGRDNHTSPTESSNNALSAGHIDDIDSLAQTCMYDQRPPKSLSPIYEMDPVEGIEQRLKTESRLMEFDFEDQQFVERDWTLLRELLADHGSDVDIINSVPEDLSLAQYLINQTLLLARENPKSQGKAWGDLSSPFEDSTSVTVTSFSPDECSSPHGEWTILELETHH